MHKMDIQAVLFDRDGVLTYFDVPAATTYFQGLVPVSIYEIAGRWQVFGARMGFPRNMAEESRFFAKFWTELADEFNLTPGQRVTLNNLDYTRFIVPYGEVQLVLEHLRAHHIKLGVLSNFSLASLDQSLVAAGIAPYFDAVCAATVIGAAKPSAQAYRTAVAALQVDPDHCLLFDDEPDCVEGACKVGLRAFRVDRHSTTHELSKQVIADLGPVPLLALGTFDDTYRRAVEAVTGKPFYLE